MVRLRVGEFNVEVRSGASWYRQPDAIVTCGFCGGTGLDTPERGVPVPGKPCSSCEGEGKVVEPLWNGLPWYQEDLVLDAEGRHRRNVISTVRGLPPDVSDETAEAIANRMDDALRDPLQRLLGVRSLPGRRPSWLALRELVEFDWGREVDRSGWLPMHDYARFLETGIPDLDATFSIDQLEAESEDYEYLREHEARRLLTEDPEREVHVAFVRVEWREPYARAAGEFVRFIDEVLVPLGAPDSVRIVFLAATN